METFSGIKKGQERQTKGLHSLITQSTAVYIKTMDRGSNFHPLITSELDKRERRILECPVTDNCCGLICYVSRTKVAVTRTSIFR